MGGLFKAATYVGTPSICHLKTNSPFFAFLFLLVFTIGGSSGITLGNAGIDLGLHDTYYVPGHFHFVLSLGGVVGIFSGIITLEKTLLDIRISYLHLHVPYLFII